MSSYSLARAGFNRDVDSNARSLSDDEDDDPSPLVAVFFFDVSMVSIFNSTSGPACSVKNANTVSRFV